jgi:mono/diheme cytochrome c family protein
LALGIEPISPEQLQLMARGEGFYAQCAACHGASGKGTPGLAPALANSPWVLGPPEWLGRIILQGMNGPVEIEGKIWNGVMPPHGHLQELDDETLAGLMIYMRRAWGHKANPVRVDVVRDIRQSSEGRSDPWTVAELEAVAIDRGFGRFQGKYTLSFITLTIVEQEEGLFIEVPMYGGGQLAQLNDMTFEIDTGGGEKVQIEFVVETDGSVSKMLLYRGKEIMTAERKQD